MKINCETEAVRQMAQEILVAARTAPKGKGLDSIVTALAEPEDIRKLADVMRERSLSEGSFFARDASNIENSDAVVFIGLKDSEPLGLNCGGCGFSSCAEFVRFRESAEAESEKSQADGGVKKTGTPFKGPVCLIKAIDLGIALGSAAAKAKDMCLDSRVMYTAGAAACSCGLLDAQAAIALPLKVSGKNIYFDRKKPESSGK
ncbi:hypothetical protein J5839_03995 [Methanosarcinaceae archaeon]|nr:hypothetical protein [Methanosarcinaceae archaeon]